MLLRLTPVPLLDDWWLPCSIGVAIGLAFTGLFKYFRERHHDGSARCDLLYCECAETSGYAGSIWIEFQCNICGAV